jgi:uncharacterized protein YggE
MKSLIALAVLMPLPAVAQTVQVSPTPDAPVVSVSATEAVRATPDVAMVGVGVTTLAPTAVAALQGNSVKMDRVLSAVRAAGVPATEVQTRGMGVNAEYDYVNRQQTFRGYRASNSVSVRTRDIARLGRFLDAMIVAGGNQIDGPTFSIDKPEALREQARDLAVQKAQAQADAYARRTGHRRARLLAISEGYNRDDIVVTASLRSFDVQEAAPPPVVAPPVAPGQVATSVTVNAVYRLEN